MSAADHLGTYAEGWTKGDLDTILRPTADDYTLDDPNAGVITRAAFADYLSKMKEAVAELCGGTLPASLLELSELQTQESDGVLTAWVWWQVPGTDFKGSGLIKVDADGVRSEILTYYTKLPA